MKKIIYLLVSLLFVTLVACEDKESSSSNGGFPVYTSGTENGHDYVDLGLPSGTLWATCNVGAAAPQDYGNYYAWGETTTKDSYEWGNYKFGSRNDGNTLLTKYCFDSEYGKDGFCDNKTVLDLEDDAANVNWGGRWTMPTKAQQDELRAHCYWVWTENYNNSKVAGFIVYKAKASRDKGIYNGQTPSASYSLEDAHIFLPAAGVHSGHDFYMRGTYGLYSSSSLLTEYYSNIAWYMAFYQVYVGYEIAIGGFRSDGQSVRAVISKNGGGSDSNGNNSGDNGSNDSDVSQLVGGTEVGYDYVDLGLTSGTMWATCNVGASKPEEYGNYYAWGETITKGYYDWSTYKYGSVSNQLTKYCSRSDYGKDGFTDSKTTLDLPDDAAYVNWSGKWRMPTKAQQDELRNECYWVWTENYNSSGVKGYIIYKAKSSSDMGKHVYKGQTPSLSYTISDAHIFLPAAGDRYCGNLYNAGAWGYYWSSSLDATAQIGALLVNFRSDDVGCYFDTRCNGKSVRAVIPGN
ncbi:MAG: hypothetical protein J6K01_07740 [Paludibacteraceae bacterium]|nr:hypothetical protein [Paludibacteraceae bacterium]